MTIEDAAVELSREERRRRQNEATDALVASGALDEVLAKVDAGETLTGDGGLLGSLIGPRTSCAGSGRRSPSPTAPLSSPTTTMRSFVR